MLTASSEVLSQFETILKKRDVPFTKYAEYKKWLRYFLDFCAKYSVPDSKEEQLRLFIEKLREKKQTEAQCDMAVHTVSLHYETLKPGVSRQESADSVGQQQCITTSEISSHPTEKQRKSQYTEAGYEEISDSAEWDEILTKLAAEIKVRHYSRKTLKTYAQWARRFQRFLKNKSPQELSTCDVKEYLTFLAVKCRVAASTQNQAFNSLLFLFRHGLKREFGELRGVPRAKKSLYIPTVLSRPEIDAILAQLTHPHNLVAKVLFGCGLRLFEGLQLRVGDFNFDAGKLLVHGKGKKDRTVPIPESIIPELKAH